MLKASRGVYESSPPFVLLCVPCPSSFCVCYVVYPLYITFLHRSYSYPSTPSRLYLPSFFPFSLSLSPFLPLFFRPSYRLVRMHCKREKESTLT